MKLRFALPLLLLSLATWAQDPEESSPPDTVRVGVYVISIHDINFHDKQYTIRFWLWLQYANPDFDFSTQLDIPNAKTVEEPTMILDSVDGKAWVMMKMKCEMKQNWNVDDFPFDSQRLKLHIENTLFDKDALVFQPDVEGSTYDKELTLDGWDITHFDVNTSINDYETAFGGSGPQESHYASFNIEIEIERDAWGLFLKIFIGMYIAFLISTISFTPHPSELEPRFGLPVGGLFAAVGNKYIIDSLLPESSTFTLVDTLHSLTFFSIFATLMVSAFALVMYERKRESLALTVSRIGAFTVIIAFLTLNVVFVLLAWL